MGKQLVIIGAGGHGKVVADIAHKNGYTDIVFLDDNEDLKSCGNYAVVGTCNDAVKYSDREFVVGIGANEIRRRTQKVLYEKGLHIVSLVHPHAVVAADVALGSGTVVMAGAVINPGSRIGSGCIVNTGATVDHDSTIADYVHVSVGSHLAGTVSVGAGAWIGAGAIISNNIKICAECVIGAGAVVVKDLTEPDTYIGVPARKMSIASRDKK